MPTPAATLDATALNRATLARQLLLTRTSRPAIEVVEQLGGLQAQAPLAPYVGLWSRIEGFTPDDLAGPLVDRRVVRLSLMRGTVHLVSAEDCLWLRPTLQAVHDRYLAPGAYGKAVAGMDLADLAAAGRTLVDEQACTNGELRDALTARWPDRDAAALATVIRMLVPLVQVPPRGIWGRGGQATHTSAEAWLGQPLAEDPDPDRLVRRYLAAFGPAGVGDAQTWSGLTRLGEVFERLRPELVTFRDDQGRELFDLPDAPRPDPDDAPAPVRFLPEYDNLLRSHEDRTRVLSPQARERLVTKNDSPKPTFLVDGVVAGGWKIDRKRRHATLTVEPFVPLSDDQLAAVTAEAECLLDFAASADGTREILVTAP